MKIQASALRRCWGALRHLVGVSPPRGVNACAQDKLAALSACVAGLLLTACSETAVSADVVIINGNEPESLDPAIVTAVPDMRVARALFEGLLRLDGKTGRPSPGWAESWEVS